MVSNCVLFTITSSYPREWDRGRGSEWVSGWVGGKVDEQILFTLLPQPKPPGPSVQLPLRVMLAGPQDPAHCGRRGALPWGRKFRDQVRAG